MPQRPEVDLLFLTLLASDEYELVLSSGNHRLLVFSLFQRRRRLSGLTNHENR